MVDDQDYEKAMLVPSWRIKKEGRRIACMSNIKTQEKKRTTVCLHRFILDAKPGEYIMHMDHNGLNNTRENLRFCTPTEFSRHQRKALNTKSKYKGVKAVFISRIYVNGKAIELGTYKSEDEAALAYNKAAIKYFGELATLNIIE